MMKLHGAMAAAALLAHTVGYAGEYGLAQKLFCAKAGQFTQVYSENRAAGKERKESAARAVAALDQVFQDKVDARTLELLMVWSAFADKLPGYRSGTHGMLAAFGCSTFLEKDQYLQFGAQESVAALRKLADTCEAQADEKAAGACIKAGFPALPLEKMD
jgi:hypothetical protein